MNGGQPLTILKTQSQRPRHGKGGCHRHDHTYILSNAAQTFFRLLPTRLITPLTVSALTLYFLAT